MSITSGGMGRSVGQAFADHGFGGSWGEGPPAKNPFNRYAERPGVRTPLTKRGGSGRFTLRSPEGWFERPNPNDFDRMPPRSRDPGFRRDAPGPPNRPAPGHGFTPAGARAFGVAPARGGGGNRGAAGQQAQGRQDERQHKLPTFRNAAGKKIPAGRVAAKAVSKLVHGGRLTKNQNIVVGKALRNMNPNQRRNFVNEVALRRGPGKNVNVVKKNLVKPLGRAVKVAKAHRQANKAKRGR